MRKKNLNEKTLADLMAIYEIFQHIVEITLGPRLPRIVGRRKVYQLVGIPKQGKPSMVYTKCS